MRLLNALAAFLAAICTALGSQPGEVKTEVFMQSLKTALSQFESDFGRYPTTMEGLAPLIRRPSGTSAAPAGGWHGPHVESVQDAWKRDFVYLCPGVHNTNGFDLYSRGEDGLSRSGGKDADDINNWDSAKSWRRHYAHAARMRRIRPFAYGIAVVIGLAVLAWGARRISGREELSR